MLWASAVSERNDLRGALGEAAGNVSRALQGTSVDLAFIFVSQHFAAHYADVPALLGGLLPARVLLGCSAGGVIGAGREVEQRPGVALVAAALPGVRVEPFSLLDEALPDADAPPSAWHNALAVTGDSVPQFVLLADPFSFSAERLLAGLDYAYPRSVKVGGLASGAAQPGGNALYLDRSVRREGAVGVALSGDIAVDTIVAQGCRGIGRTFHITRSDGHMLFELDGKPALQVLRELVETLSGDDRELVSRALFLGIAMDELAPEPRAGDFLIRNLMGIDVQRGAFAVGEHLRNGQCVQFHVRDARASAADLQEVLERFGSSGRHAVGALLFSCLGRGVHLYGRQDHDTELFRKVVGDVPLGGFFCNGEIGPVGGATYLHGYTSSFGLFRAVRQPAALGAPEASGS